MKIKLYSTLLWAFSVFILAACGGGSNSSTSPDINLRSLSLNTTQATLKVSDSTQVTVTATFTDNSTSNVSSLAAWTSSDSSIATVSNNGLVKAISAGTVTISASSSNISQSLTLTVIELSSLSISPTTQTLALNTQQPYVATGLYSDNSTEDLTTQVDWSVDNTTFAGINNAGLLTSKSSGSVVVSATLDGQTGTANATISSAVLNTISLKMSSAIAISSTHQVVATGLYSDGSSQDVTQQVSWTITDTTIASVDATGLVSTLAEGTTTITANFGTVSQSTSFSVTPATLTSIELSPNVLELPAGNNSVITVTAFYSDSSIVDVSHLTSWDSSDTSIATIDPTTATVSAIAEGSATLTATFSGLTSQLQVTVNSAVLKSISILPINATLPTGLNLQYSAEGHYSDGSSADITQQVTWLSSDSTIASIENITHSKGLALAHSQGNVSVTAVLNSISQSTSLTGVNAILQAIEVEPNNQTVAKGTQLSIKATGRYSDGSKVNITHLVQWSSINHNVINISNAINGQISATAQGTSLINATLDNVTGLGQINVTSAVLNSITISSSLTSLPKGTQQQLIATGNYSDATTQNLTQQVVWQSSDSAIIGVDYSEGSEGIVIANSTGTADISASLVNSNASIINQSITLTANSATLVSLTIAAPQASLNTHTSLHLTANATFSDDSTKDVTQEVDWLSSDETLASISNSTSDAGLLNALSSGNASISATLNNVFSNILSIEITQDINAPVDLELTIQNNVILSNGTDIAVLNATLIPSDSTGTISDGTSVTFTITEGTTETTQSALTLNGLASINFTSSFNGLVSVVASVDGSNIQSSSALLSTTTFRDVIAKTGNATGSFDATTLTLAQGSTLNLYIRNISNRTFEVNQITISYGDSTSQTHFPDSPVTDPAFTSNHDLTGGKYTGLGYLLDQDTTATVFLIVYFFTDSTTGNVFNTWISFDFTPP